MASSALSPPLSSLPPPPPLSHQGSPDCFQANNMIGGTSDGSIGTAGSSASMISTECSLCGDLITDRFILQVANRSWHANCLRCTVCHAILDGHTSCFLKDDLVCNKFQREGQLAETVPICPAELQPQMLSEAHSSSTGGHAKDFKTYSRILQLTWWPGLFADVNRFINECNKCQETAAAPRRPNAPLKPLECPKTPLDTVHIDLMGPYPSSYGQKYLVIISDAFTKFAEFTTIDTKTPENTAKAFFETWVARYGVPAVLISDRGTEWRASLFRELSKLLKIDHRMTSPYYPQSNAKSEVINKTVISYIKATIERLQDWPDLIPSLQFSYNTGVSKATQFSPFQLMFGLRPKTPFSDPNLMDRKFYGEQYPQMVMQ